MKRLKEDVVNWRKRVKENKSPFPGRHAHTYFDPKDTEIVSQSFEEQFEKSLITNKFVLNTTTASIDETLQQFKQQIKPFISSKDRLRLLNKNVVEKWWLLIWNNSLNMRLTNHT